MKLTLHKKTKKFILIILVFLLLFAGIQTYNTVTKEETATKETVIFEYSCHPSVDYTVYILPNELYPGTELEEGRYYSKRLLDYIQADFAVEYQGSDSVPVKIQYQVLATVNGYQGQAENKNIYWTKNFPLFEKKVVEIEGDSCDTTEQINFTLDEYDALAVRAKDLTGMNVTNEVIVELLGTVTTKVTKEEVTIPFSTNLEIPLLEDVFQVKKSVGEPIKGLVTETEEAILPVDRVKVSLFAILILLCIAAIPILMFVIKEPDELAMLRKKNSGLIKNYGSRMVAMKEIPDMEFSRYYQVYSIKDMIKIADEVQKPIIYVPDENTAVRNNELLIINENSLYRWFSA